MLNTCPKQMSCGTNWPFWTDAPVPTLIGLVQNVTAYGVGGLDCKAWSLPIQVMRCSWLDNDDIVYRYTGQYYDTCYFAFCGTT